MKLSIPSLLYLIMSLILSSCEAQQIEHDITLFWDDMSANEDGFIIDYKGQSDASWKQMSSVATNVTSYGPITFTSSDTVHFRVSAFNDWGKSNHSNILSVVFSDTSVYTIPRPMRALSTHHHLYPNYPNPFNPTTTIPFDILKESYVKIAIYDLLGREVRVLIDCNIAPGSYEVIWDGRDNEDQPVCCNVYLVRMVYGRFTQTRRILYLE